MNKRYKYDKFKFSSFLVMFIVIVFSYIYSSFEYYNKHGSHNLQNFIFIGVYMVFVLFAFWDVIA